MDSTLGVSRLDGSNPDLPEGLPASGHLEAGSVSTQVGVTEGIDVLSLQSAAPPGGHQAIHDRWLSNAMLFTLIISGPVMLWESMWRGQPMIDQPGHLWVVPTVIVTATFFVGGAIAGRHQRRATGAIAQGVVVSLGALFGRRLYLREKKRKRISPARQ